MPLWQIVVLAVVQGITEFLPISSDGHLVLTANVLNQTASQLDVSSVVIALHMGTLASIIVFYWHRLWALLREDRRLIPLLIIGTIPAVILGLPIKLLAEKEILENPLLAGLMLPVTGLALIWSSRRPPGKTDYRQLNWREATAIGVAQAAAILPGLSRSGSTIATALGLGLTRQSAATFSFLLAVPALAGAGVLELVKVARKGDFQPAAAPVDLGIGIVISFVVGLGALWVLVRMLERGRFAMFGWYCILLGVGVTVWQLSLLAGSTGASH
jgi:undecaprenyl-diphosphatase